MKHIGILAHSYEGATLCFHEMCAEGVRRLGPHDHPEITLTCSPMAHSLDAWGRGDQAELRSMFLVDAEKLVTVWPSTGCGKLKPLIPGVKLSLC